MADAVVTAGATMASLGGLDMATRNAFSPVALAPFRERRGAAAEVVVVPEIFIDAIAFASCPSLSHPTVGTFG